jgi:hypothetical protein
VAEALVTELVGVTVSGTVVAGVAVVPPVPDTESVSVVPFTELVKVTLGVPKNPVPVMVAGVAVGDAESAIVVGDTEVMVGAGSTVKAPVAVAGPLSSMIDRL